jgi:hypothetical protein
MVSRGAEDLRMGQWGIGILVSQHGDVHAGEKREPNNI